MEGNTAGALLLAAQSREWAAFHGAVQAALSLPIEWHFDHVGVREKCSLRSGVTLFDWCSALRPRGRALLSLLREMSDDMAFLAVTPDGVVQDRIDALAAGVDDCVERRCDPLEVAARVQAVLRRRTNDAPPTMRSLVERLEAFGEAYSLSQREQEALALLANGKHPKEIAGVMGCNYATVRTHLRRLSKKIGCSGSREALTAVFTWRVPSVVVYPKC